MFNREHTHPGFPRCFPGVPGAEVSFGKMFDSPEDDAKGHPRGQRKSDSPEADPNGSSALTEAAGFYAQIRDAERVYDLVDRFESLRSSNPGAWQAIARIHESMGDDAEVDRARLCATVDEEGCWGED